MTTIHTRFAIFALIDAKKMKIKIIQNLRKCPRPVGYVMLGLASVGVCEVVVIRCAVFVVRAVLW